MIKEFIPYEQALALKELGFDEPCLAYYEGNELTHGMLNDIGKKRYLQTPIFQQAFRWFREKYALYVVIDESVRPQIKNSFGRLLFEYCKDGKYSGFDYKEAELACLKKLIEIANKIGATEENMELTSLILNAYPLEQIK